MAFDTQGALKAGYSPAEVTDFLGKQANFDVDAARKNGYQDSEIMSHLESLAASTAKTPIATNPAPDSGVMGGDDMYAPIVAAGEKKPFQSVLAKPNAPAPLPTEDKMLNPDFVNAMQAKLDSMPEEERLLSLNRMAARPDVYGRAAKAIGARYAALDKIQTPTMRKVDPRLEAQTERYIDQNRPLELAKLDAREQALSGQLRPDYAKVSASPVEYTEAEEYRVKENLTGIGGTKQVLARGGKKALLGYEQGVRGVNQFVGDTFGFDMSTNKARMDSINRFSTAMGEQSSKPLNLIEGAITSIAQQLPSLVGGALTGSQGLVLTNMFAQSFGQTYDDGKRRGLDTVDNATRSAMYASLEAIGEKFGLGDKVKGLKAVANGLPSDKIAGFFARALVKEIPGEELTYAGQFAVDKGYGLNPEAGLAAFFSGAADTALATVIQGGIMTGAGVVAGKGVNKAQELRDRIKANQRQGYAQDTSYEGLSSLIAQSKGFLAPETKAQKPTKPIETAANQAEQIAAETTSRQQKIEERAQALERTGIAPDDAIRLAEDDVTAEEQKIQNLSKRNAVRVKDALENKAVPYLTQVKTRAIELIDSGVDPAIAYSTAVQQIKDELENDAVNEEEGALDVTGPKGKKTGKRAAKPAAVPGVGPVAEGSTALGEPVGGADRAGVSVAEQPEEVPTTQGIEESQPDTVVSTGPATDGTTVGAGQQPNTLTRGSVTPDAVRALSDEQLNTELTNTSLSDAEYKLVKTELTQRQQATVAPDSKEAYAQRTQGEKAAPAWEDVDARVNRVADRYEKAGMPDKAAQVRESLNQQRPTYTGTAELEIQQDQELNPPETKGTTTDGTKAPETVKTKTKRQKAPSATDVTGVDIDAASKVTDPAEIEQLMLKVDAEFNSLRGKDGRMPKKDTPKQVRADALSELYRALKAKLPTTETPVAESAPATSPVVEPEVVAETPVAEAPVEQGMTETEREALDPESREEVELLDDLLNNYNNNPDETSAKTSAQQIYKTANDVEKPKAARAYAQQLLDNEVDSKDYRVGARVLPASKVGQSKVDTKFTGFTNGVQAASHIMKTGNVFQKFLAKRLRGALGGIKFVVLEKGDPTPASLQKEGASKWSTAFGAYVPGDRTVYVRGASFGDMQGINNIVVLHELLHAATSQKIRLGKIAIRQGVSKTNDVVAATMDLIMIMGNAQQRFNELKAAGRLPAYIASLEKSGVFTNVDEFLAYGMSDETFQKFLMNTKGFGEDSSAFSKFVHSVAKFFGMAVQQENAMMDLIVASDRLLSAKGSRNMQLQAKLENQGKVLQSSKIEEDEEPAKIEAGARSQKDLDKAVAEANFKFESSEKAAKAAKGVSAIQMMQDPSKAIPALKALWKRVNSAKRNALVKVLPTQVLVDWVGNDVPELQKTYTLMQKMAGMTNQLLRGASELSNDVERAYRADPELPAKLNKITSIATLAETDPATIDTAERSPALDKLWKDLGPEGQRVYIQIRDHFGNLSKYLSKLLDDQVNNSKLSALDKANLMKKIRSTFERGGKINPYFALVRDGDFWLSMGDGKTRQFFMAETEAERDNVAREFAAEQLKRKDGEKDSAWEKRIDDKLAELYSDGAFERGNDIRALRKKAYSQGEGNMLSEVFDAIDKTDLGSPEANDSLKDAIYQAFLETMPDQSFRKQFIHRKGIAGFRPDVLRNTAHASARMATQLARIKYSPLLRTSLSAAEDSIKGRIEFEPFVNDMKERVDASIAPKAQSTASRIVGGLNKASFIYYLSGASSALLQPLSVFQTGLPVLARYGAFNATKEMGKMFKVWNQLGMHKTNNDGTKSWVAPSVEHSNLSPEERRAYNAAAAMDLFTATQAGSVFEYKATPSDELKSPKVKLANSALDALVFGGLMNSSERISREMMFMASFNLNMKEHKNFSRAVEQAVLDTNAALGNYGEYARPAFMNGLSGKLLTQFMMYPLHITTFLIKNFREMIKPMDKRTRGEAAQKFFGTLGTTFILAGASGLPMFSAVMGLLGAAWDEMRDDLPEDIKSMDFELWFRTKFLDDQLGGVSIGDKKLSDIVDRGFVNAFTGLDIAGRTGANNLFFRDSKETATLRESATAIVLEKLGPSANMLLTMVDGFDAAMQGDYTKAVKKWSPAGFRNFITAYELASKGAKDNKGAEILSTDAVNTGQLIAQSIGFRPDLLANTQYVTFKVLGLEQKIKNERNKVVENLDRAHRNEDNKAFESTLEKIVAFNKKYPAYEITEDNLLDSLEKRAEQRGQSWRGFTPTEENISMFSEALAPSRRAADEAERKGRGE